ncbi:hypothetical protein M408DRAFT_331442 [Serendipita vermifera MAFF 305830]|uniref:Thioredoxin domain-containing protein n=1 Tax=Serendipita vermifera MAFF 305830 TaxID=933852 RepID=A0A0C2WEU5_SERVB|nr:hypothetical protein M408DRAFT_331442 [Serendipita vermifera MAFF 305830]
MVLLTPPTEWLSSPPQLPAGEVIIIFYASIDPVSGVMWCPDCRKVKSTIDWLFNGNDKPAAYIIYVGSKSEWKAPAKNHFRTDFKVDSVPTMIKYQDGKEVYRLVEDEILDTNALGQFF